MGGTAGEAIRHVDCPECGQEVKMGLPRSTRIESVTGTQDPELDEEFLRDQPRHKRRQNACENGHRFHVYFGF